MGKQSEAIARELGQFIAQIKAEFGRRLVEKLQAATPVDTHYAQSRWRLVTDGSGLDVVNDADYIMVLNDGWSKQAPAGFIERCIDEVMVEMEIVFSRPTRIGLSSGEVFEYHP